MPLIVSDEPTVEFSVVIPVFNSEQSLPLVVAGATEELKKLGATFEFVLVDDGSADGSWKAIEALHQDGNVCGIRFMKNMGHSIALKRGLEFCKGQWVITMDDDLQHPPSELPKLVSAARDNPDMDVIMGAYSTDRGSMHKSLGSRLYQFVLRKAFSLSDDLVVSSFRVLHRRIVDLMVNRNISSPHAGFMILAATDKIMNVEVERHDRKFGKSGMSLKKSVTTLLDSLVLSSEWPLKLIGFGGLAMSGFAVLLALYYALQYFTGHIGVSGFATTVLLIIGFSGVILASISVVGLYVMRILQQVTFSPHYGLRDYLEKK